ncbi:hypothetical protein AMTR_s00029p00241780 [Amborella trichopoda]|uniref:aspartate--tRNA ligase n=2 Tax=Amborella trichopoda TaxID=13333 RepID=W1PRC8_AMBTC|nr:hypothetical protein AMTR_s00029p00241780 [Amborella trichopoda]
MDVQSQDEVVDEFNNSDSECNNSDSNKMLPPPEEKFQYRDELLNYVRNFAMTQGYMITIKRSEKDRRVVLGCDRGGTYKSNGYISLQKRKTKSRLISCPFQMLGVKKSDGLWVLKLKNPDHNHGPWKDISSHPFCRRFSEEEILRIKEMNVAGFQPRQILDALKQSNPNLQAVLTDVYNVKGKIRLENRYPIYAPDLSASNYGDLSIEEFESKKVGDHERATIESLSNELKGKEVWVRARVHSIREVSKNMVFLILKEKWYTLQCVVTVTQGFVSQQMVKYVSALGVDSFVDVYGVVVVPGILIKGASQQVEIQAKKVYCVNRAVQYLPFNLEDAAQSESEFLSVEQAGEQIARVIQETRPKHRFLELGTPANQGIFHFKYQIEEVFRHFLSSKGFIGVHTPKLVAGASEGGSSVFKLEYKGQPACLAQSPQLHKQMLAGQFSRVFEIGPAFRAEDSYTHRHLCEFISLDVEMEVEKGYFELLDFVDWLFVSIFDELNERCKKELAAINEQYPFEPLKYLRKTLRLTFEEGIQMLREAGIEADLLGDLNIETERKLGQIVRDKFNTDFYILHRYPLALRPFYTLPCSDNTSFGRSFDVFMRGEEIISGGQRIHIPQLLVYRAKACGIDTNAFSDYLDSFWYGMPAHGGFGCGLERLVMLFCGLDDIRKVSAFPRDPYRLTP